MTREEKYKRLGELTDLQFPEKFDMKFLGLNLGLNVVALDSFMQKDRRYGYGKSMRDNVVSMYGKEAEKLVEELLVPVNITKED